MVTVSVVIPTYNRASLLGEAIKSVLDQTYSDYEIIVVDDGSTDNTRDIVNQFKVENLRYFYQEKKGVSVARNRGIHEARGQYIAFLDSDDLFLPEKLKLQIDLFEKTPELGMVYGAYTSVDEKENEISIHPARAYPGGYKEMLTSCTVATPTVMVKRVVLEQVGAFDEVMSLAEDVDLWCRIFRYHPIDMIETPVSKVRIHSGGTPRDPEAVLNAYMYLLVKAFRADQSLSWPFKRRTLARIHYLCAADIYSRIDPKSDHPNKYHTYFYYYTKAARYWPFSRLGMSILWRHYTRHPRALMKLLTFPLRFEAQMQQLISRLDKIEARVSENLNLESEVSKRQIQWLASEAGKLETPTSINLDVDELESVAERLANQLDWNEAYPIFHKYGFHLLRRHFYLPIPELEDRQYLKRSTLPGITIDDSVAFELLDQAVAPYKEEFSQLPVNSDSSNESKYYLLNSAFMAIDSNVYYGLVRHYKPRRIIEIGSGFSTLLASEAVRKNVEEANAATEIICIEPHPSNMLRSFEGEITLLTKKVQETNFELFTSLGENDILFIDSSHVLREGGDVWYEYCEILPSLSPNVLVHVHDVSLPNPYPEVYFHRQVFWNEQYLLQTFLSYNKRFEIIWPGNYLMLKYPERMQQVFTPEYELMRAAYPASEPSSFWMRVRGE